jgi:hypothetical protein
LPFNAPLKNLESFKKAIENVIAGNESKSAEKNGSGNPTNPAETGNDESAKPDAGASASTTFANNVASATASGLAKTVNC